MADTSGSPTPSVTAVGYFLASEDHGPAELVEQARMAEQAGFTSLWISDHYHPWNSAQGHSPFVWSVLGALAEATSLPVQTAVTCPTVRVHPAVVAQAAATSAVLLGEGRFRLGVGTGEALNEHVLGDRWPPAPVRLEMLEEAVRLIRTLCTGQETTHHGRHYTVENARLYDVPDGGVPIDVAGFGPSAVELAGRIGDGFITTEPDSDAVARFRRAGGGQNPVRGGAKVSYDTDRDRAAKAVLDRWPNMFLPGELAQVLPTPAHFEQASRLVTEQHVTDSGIPLGDDPDEHVRALLAYRDAGFNAVHVSQIGPDLQGFFDFYRSKVLPRLTA
ncbi:TIGR03557 family F420-dependent LLM class oxidoreductase [Streptomyces alkaliterrae]|uniref:TIGR03557 family F420-dependent LLM class oxidoreductase n=1 Tax=Streptomyces alkaliterrae TaxID=2213162 RepID=A0A5P0YU55_9ACTN|nr:TIGR03557 family F420-dependent LLM class oxidoreductase [Streptomyces alkaliterrae]MBB1258926.1 TIGR03557 family F420-dependent LLM class oxidoreductase [Streptomyces alkaliterrae]MQS03841.1 TIGR03557 family F420-dependent LLM class oxidoreductase [Streptomyces alkaliterrae]